MTTNPLLSDAVVEALSGALYATTGVQFPAYLRDALTAIDKALTAAGYAVVPVEPTLDMIVAGTEDWMKIRAAEDRAEAIWKAMLSAAQTGEEG